MRSRDKLLAVNAWHGSDLYALIRNKRDRGRRDAGRPPPAGSNAWSVRAPHPARLTCIDLLEKKERSNKISHAIIRATRSRSGGAAGRLILR
jgi:hypothetical protein